MAWNYHHMKSALYVLCMCIIKKLPLVGRVRDHDNIEEKHVLDIISSFYLKSDSGLFVDTFHMTRLGTEDGTFLFVMESSRFPGWIRENSQSLDIEKEAL